jgi:hypothetical protein
MTAPRPSPIACDASALPADATAVGALARLQLGAKRESVELRLSGVSRELLELLALCGLAAALGVEAGGQPEQREERVGIEEERQLGDPPT